MAIFPEACGNSMGFIRRRITDAVIAQGMFIKVVLKDISRQRELFAGTSSLCRVKSVARKNSSAIGALSVEQLPINDRQGIGAGLTRD